MGEFSCDWSVVAATWDAKRAEIELTNHGFTAELLHEAKLAPGQQVLELGCGNGELARALAQYVRPGGTVLASDVAAEMVAVTRAYTAGDDSVEVRRIDAMAIDAEDASFDAVVFRMGLMLVADPTIALQEIRRVLRPGGRLAAAVWGGPQHNPWLVSVGMAAMMHGLVQSGPPVGPGGPLSLHDPVALDQRARDAGFTDVSVRVVDYVRHYESADQHFDMVSVLAPPIAAALRRASAEQAAAWRETVRTLTAQHQSDSGLELPAQANLLIAC